MHWHIITGSKGGIGKTLLTLLLLEYHLERKPKEGVLVLDLNATNVDTSAMLLYGERNDKKVGESFLISIGNKEEITIQKVFSSDEHRRERYFVVGWPANPFTLYGRDLFPTLLSGIKQLSDDIAKKTGLSSLQHVIIDTNYHFCNLFSNMDEHYQEYTGGELKDEVLTVWFLWVYRQLDRFFKGEIQTGLMKETAGAMERQLRKGGLGPIVHTYAPMGLMSVEPHQQSFWSFWSKIFGGQLDPMRKDQDYPIEKLIALEKLTVGEYVEFDKWMNRLKVSYNNVDKKRNEDTHLLFVNVLDEAVRQLAEMEEAPFLPINIFPLSVYQSALEGYTDKDRADIVAALGKIRLYTNFATLLDKKYKLL